MDNFLIPLFVCYALILGLPILCAVSIFYFHNPLAYCAIFFILFPVFAYWVHVGKEREINYYKFVYSEVRCWDTEKSVEQYLELIAKNNL